MKRHDMEVGSFVLTRLLVPIGYSSSIDLSRADVWFGVKDIRGALELLELQDCACEMLISVLKVANGRSARIYLRTPKAFGIKRANTLKDDSSRFLNPDHKVMPKDLNLQMGYRIWIAKSACIRMLKRQDLLEYYMVHGFLPMFRLRIYVANNKILFVGLSAIAGKVMFMKHSEAINPEDAIVLD